MSVERKYIARFSGAKSHPLCTEDGWSQFGLNLEEACKICRSKSVSCKLFAFDNPYYNELGQMVIGPRNKMQKTYSNECIGLINDLGEVVQIVL